MQYRTVGRTGITVSHYQFGAMSFGALGNRDHDDCVRIIHRALDAGVNTIDTADIYSSGESETIVGKALAGRRDDVVLATKCYWPMGRDVNQRGLSRRWIIRAVEDSLRRLGTDYIDIYYMHKPDLATDIEESLSAMTDLLSAGKIRTVAVSTFPADRIVEAQWVASKRRLAPPRRRAAAVLDLRTGHRTRCVASVRPLRHGCLRVGPAQLWLAHRQVRARARSCRKGLARSGGPPTKPRTGTTSVRPCNASTISSTLFAVLRARRACRSRISRWRSATSTPR